MSTRTFRIILVVLSLCGTVVGAELLLIHIKQISVPGFQSFCSLSETINCDVVARSDWAEIFGVPIAALGFLYYLFVLLLVTLEAAGFFPLRIAAPSLFVLSGSSFVYSVFLAYISSTALGVICLLCSALYVINILTFAASWVYVRNPIAEILAAERSLRDDYLRQPVRSLAVLLLLVLPFLISAVCVRTWMGEIREKSAARAEGKSVVVLTPEKTGLLYGGGQAGNDGPSSPLVIVEFGDFECPHCRDMSLTFHEVLRAFGDKVTVQFKNYPLDSSCNDALKVPVHPRACSAAIAAECAGRQGKFWPYYDILFQNQLALDPDSLMGYAMKVGADVDTFKECLTDPSVLGEIKADIALGRRLGIDGVPVFIIKDRMYLGARPAEDLRSILQANLP